jgi:nicotinate (nicotinamide) nucleotide adenylyltransferase/ribosome silencing factor RsfS/YbeB/iojap
MRHPAGASTLAPRGRNAGERGPGAKGWEGEGIALPAARHRRIGLLGGSFNPAHLGHLHLSLTALRRLDLDEVWWLVSPQNPLKPAAGMDPFAARLDRARQVAAGHNRIRVTDLENRLDGSRYTVDTVKALCRRYPRLRFVWLMGGDNLVQIRRWDRWTEIFQTVPIAVFDRPSYALKALAGLAAKRFARDRLPVCGARRLAETKPPVWVFFHTRLDPSSATRLRFARKQELSQTFTEQGPELATITALPSRPRPRHTRRASSQEILDLVLKTLDDGKAEDVVTIDLAGKTTIADHMVIATGRAARQVAALTERLEEALSPRARIAIEGKAQGDWVLIDAGDVIVHLFRPEIRSYYNLEKLWSEALPDAEAVWQ